MLYQDAYYGELLRRKWDHASCTGTSKLTGDRFLNIKANWNYIRGSWWPSGFGVCLARRRSWVRFQRRHISRFFFLSGYLLCESRIMLSKFNCNTLDRKTVPSFVDNLTMLKISITNSDSLWMFTPKKEKKKILLQLVYNYNVYIS